MKTPSLTAPRDDSDFSLVLGGPLYQLFCKTHLCGKLLQLARRRILVLCAIAWLPLLALSILEGTAWGHAVKVPFLLDVEVYARFLLALPLLIAAELVVHDRIRSIVRQFLEQGLIPDNGRQRFDAAIASALRLRNSVPAEVVLIVFAYGLGAWLIWHEHMILDMSSWRGSLVNGEPRPSFAGLWSSCVSLPLLQFLLLRWYYRLFIWARFLWQVSRLDLHLFAAHPDRAAGLNFLTLTPYAFSSLLLAQGVLVAGMIADRIFFAGETLPQFKVEIAGLVLIAALVVLGPLLVFVPPLGRLKRAALRDHGAFAQCYVRDYEEKWLQGRRPSGETLLGSADIQSLADLGNSFEVVKKMRIVPFNARTLAQLAVVTLIPVLPLLLTMISFDELLQRLIKVIF